jgi:hypothetical protein
MGVTTVPPGCCDDAPDAGCAAGDPVAGFVPVGAVCPAAGLIAAGLEEVPPVCRSIPSAALILCNSASEMISKACTTRRTPAVLDAI